MEPWLVLRSRSVSILSTTSSRPSTCIGSGIAARVLVSERERSGRCCNHHRHLEMAVRHDRHRRQAFIKQFTAHPASKDWT